MTDAYVMKPAEELMLGCDIDEGQVLLESASMRGLACALRGGVEVESCGEG